MTQCLDQWRHDLAKTGIYGRLRHPEYLGLILVMTEFLLQWPTLLTLLMFPVLVVMQVRLTKREERDALREFGDRFLRY
ncbi:isoprenylcysteine carboxylmethyltransferase family protein [Cyanobium sp. T1G-Tous]|uniref:methyltransferase family protein n=1 Tax=Cyanobium sp. T1G-Tous TaxID=2823722 RepID=UPI0020CE94DE|nr:isoprenylcysteine carboxylmethyltransferase family protein [Cyanobium sp. T1G-Tous]MCP9804720.1 isoprenylcysteine carboxylmethyltransferase family protein [Cyanobium sp. T1G-Tous]